MILKVAHNIRLNTDMNISISTEKVVDTEEEAEEMGVESARFLKRYIDAFGNEFQDDEE